MKNDNLLIVFATNNQFKTETKAPGKEKSGWINRFLFRNDIYQSQGINYDKFICLNTSTIIDETWKRAGFRQLELRGGDQGERLYDAFSEAFRNHYKKVLIFAGNYGETEKSLINCAFSSLDENEIVIGPDNSGGYYLLGMNQMLNNLFINKYWNGHTVLKDTIRDIVSSGKSFHLMAPMNESGQETMQHHNAEDTMSVSI